MQGRMVDLQRQRATPGKRNCVERIKFAIFFDALLTIEAI